MRSWLAAELPPASPPKFTKDLTTPADQERITALALQVAEESLQSLSQLADAAAWAGYSERSVRTLPIRSDLFVAAYL